MLGRRAFHGRDGQDAESRQDRADPRHARGLLAGRVDHRRRRAAAAPALSRRAGRDLCEHLGRGEGRVGHLLHLRQRQEDRRDRSACRASSCCPTNIWRKNVAAQTDVEIIAWAGHCEVHERFTAAEVRALRDDHPGVVVLAHPECPPEVVAEADYTGSTAGMIDYVGREKPRARRAGDRMLDERQRRGPASRRRVRAPVQSLPAHEAHHPGQDPHARSKTMRHEVTIDPAVADRARRAVERDARLAVTTISSGDPGQAQRNTGESAGVHDRMRVPPHGRMHIRARSR